MGGHLESDDLSGRVRSGALLGAMRRAVVVEFDAEAGLGRVELASGGSAGFHCVEIGGGSRTIEVGTRVLCRLAPVNLGRIEAVSLVPAASIADG